MDERAGEWEQAQYWQQHTDVLEADEVEDDEPPPARRPGRGWVRTLVRVVAVAVAMTAVIAAVRPSRRPAPPPSADVPIFDTTGVPSETVPASTDTSTDAVPSETPGEQPTSGGPSPTPSAKPRTPTTGAQRTPAGSNTGGPVPAAVAVVTPAAGMVVRVVNRASGGSVGVSQGSTADGALIVSSVSTATAQQWRLTTNGAGCFFLINVRSGKALDNPDGSSQDGAQMHQWTAVAGDLNQAWCFQTVGVGLFSIRNPAGGTLLDLRDGGRTDGTPIQQWGADPAAPNANQTWQLLRVG